MSIESKDVVSTPRTSAVGRVVGAWALVTWIVAVCLSYAYVMLRSFF